MMNITPHASRVWRQSACRLVVTLYMLDGRGGFEFRTHCSDTEDIAQIDAAYLDNAFSCREREIPVDIHDGIQQRGKITCLLRPGLQQIGRASCRESVKCSMTVGWL